jgi:uncharacterized membrane protein YqiK
MESSISLFLLIALSIVAIGFIALVIKMYHKASQGEALVRTGAGGTKVGFSGLIVIPILHRLEVMDITLKTIVIGRHDKDGLVCKDNLRADIKVTFFVRVNKTKEDVVHVAQSIGCKRASDHQQLELLFDAKFSEALKTVGKHFDFVELYNSRREFKEKIMNEIGTDLNGYVLDDCAIDYLEQTSIHSLNEQNILDSEGIKKIIDLTAKQKIQANLIEREKEKTLKKQDVEARETILELEKQQTEKEEKQRREISNIRAREQAEMEKVRQEERLKSEQARIATEEELAVAEENKNRQVVVATKNKEKTAAVETERVEQARMLEANERERIVTLAQIEKEKAVEIEKRNIQEVIRERVTVEKATVIEEEKIKDTRAHAEADRKKAVAIKAAEQNAEEALVKEIKAAEAAKHAAEHKAKRMLIDAEAEFASAGNKAQALKILAEAEAAQSAALGVSEAQVIEAKAAAMAKQGASEAEVIKMKAEAEAQGILAIGTAQSASNEKLGFVEAKINREKGTAEANVIQVKAEAEEKKGLMEAKIMSEKFMAEAKGIFEKADAMKKLDGIGRDHEEFKLRLEKDKTIELAAIEAQKDIASSQALVVSEALKVARIDIIGGETKFFDQIAGAVSKGKSVDGFINSSKHLLDVKESFMGSNGDGNFKENLRKVIDQLGVSSEDVKNLTISALLLKLLAKTQDVDLKDTISQLSDMANASGISSKYLNHIGFKI